MSSFVSHCITPNTNLANATCHDIWIRVLLPFTTREMHARVTDGANGRPKGGCLARWMATEAVSIRGPYRSIVLVFTAITPRASIPIPSFSERLRCQVTARLTFSCTWAAMQAEGRARWFKFVTPCITATSLWSIISAYWLSPPLILLWSLTVTEFRPFFWTEYSRH